MISLLSGLLSGITLPTVIGSFKFPDLGVLAWFSLIPFYLRIKKSSPRSALGQGFLFGFGFYGISLYWIFIAMHTYGDIPLWGSLLGIFLAVLLMALFPAVTAMLAALFSERGPPLWIVFPLIWVVSDFARTVIPLGGFPWSSLAYTQKSFLPLLQSLDVTGIYGITFLVIFSNAIVGECFLSLKNKTRFPLKPVLFFSLIFIATFVYGQVRLRQVRHDIEGRRTLKVSMIQGNIPQEQKWLEEKIDEIIVRHVFLSEEALKEKPALVVWPEAAYPAAISPENKVLPNLASFPIPLLIGVVSYDGVVPAIWPPSPQDIENTGFHLYNSAVLVKTGGLVADRYDKQHLVPMGEYVPLKGVFGSLNQIVPSMSSFTPGNKLNLMDIGLSPATPLRFGVTICYEDLFPSISRTFTRNGADFLVNLTNDAWYEYSSAVFQHFDFSRFRAIENRRAMVRATNTGVTGFFSPAGDVIKEAPLFKELILTAEIPVGGLTSFYTHYGDIFVWLCVVGFALVVVKFFWKFFWGSPHAS